MAQGMLFMLFSKEIYTMITTKLDSETNIKPNTENQKNMTNSC